jgi:glutaminyl-peptide cyclotransferase
MKNRLLDIFLIIILSGFGFVFYFMNFSKADVNKQFSGESAYQFLLNQTKYGPRTPGSLSHKLTRKLITDTLDEFEWSVETPTDIYGGHEIHNIIARRGEFGPITVIGAHYDSRLFATENPEFQSRNLPVPGANDGASGVAVLLELARTLPENLNGQIWLVFFDAEDQGHIEDWNWILGSRAFVQNLTIKPTRVIILDMIGDVNLNIYQEKGSTSVLSNQIWKAAAELGYSDTFFDELKYSILDDHIPFIEAGIPAVVIIDFDYIWWHTTSDTPDKVSPASLEIVGKTITHWLESNP